MFDLFSRFRRHAASPQDDVQFDDETSEGHERPVPDSLPYPTRKLQVNNGIVDEYIIPDDKKLEVLNLLYPFSPVPDLDDEMIDIHEDKPFVVRDYKVVKEPAGLFLVSPYYASSGGTVIDWMEAGSSGELSLEDGEEQGREDGYFDGRENLPKKDPYPAKPSGKGQDYDDALRAGYEEGYADGAADRT